RRWGAYATLLLLLVSVTGCGPSAPAAGLRDDQQARPEMGASLKGDEQLVFSPQPVSLVFVGDVMLARTPGAAMLKGADPFAAVAPVLRDADLAVGNLECVVSTMGEKVPKAYNFQCSPAVVPYLFRSFGAVSVANNHSGDFGKAAFAQELGLLAEGAVPFFGGGHNSHQAHAPLILNRRGLRIALLGYDEVELRSYEASEESPGLAWSDDDQVVADITAARAAADMVVVFPHWGLEYHRTPSDRQVSLAHKMIDAGADLVVGSHPHVTQTVETYKDRLVVYSLGNLVFDDFLDVPPELNEPSRTSWMLRVTWQNGAIKTWDTLPARTDDDGFPHLLSGMDTPCSNGVCTHP
ncbi:MAG: CapA family protein, partial [Mycobacterium leprae]